MNSINETFDGAREPMRALRDLISAAEAAGWVGDDDILSRARDGFTTLRNLFGDNRPADQIADLEAMIEPPLPLPDQPDRLQNSPPGCKKVRDVVIALLKLPMHADFQVDDGEEFRDFTIEHVVRETAPGDAQLVVIKPE